MIFNIFKSKQVLNATQVFECALSQAKKSFPNRFLAVSDTVEARRLKFEAISVFMCLYTWYLKEEGSKQGKKLSQNAYDLMFDRYEVALREQGVSDVRVGPEVKKLASAFTGRLVAYGEAFSKGDSKALFQCFMHNKVCDENKAKALSIELMSEANKMKSQTLTAWFENLENIKQGVYAPKEWIEAEV